MLAGYGAGDVVDRLSILSLKIFHKGAVRAHVKEHAALAADPKLSTFGSAARGNRERRAAAFALCAVNGELWGHEDQIRAFREATESSSARQPDPYDVAKVAMAIQALNDRRQELVAQLNGAVS